MAHVTVLLDVLLLSACKRLAMLQASEIKVRLSCETVCTGRRYRSLGVMLDGSCMWLPMDVSAAPIMICIGVPFP